MTEQTEQAVPESGEPVADCIFCKIAVGEIPADVVHESEATVAFRDLEPQAPTHILVIPRRHFPNAASVAANAPADLVAMFDAAREIAAQEGLSEGYRLVLNTGAQAHQTVFHAHLHVLGGRFMTWPPG